MFYSTNKTAPEVEFGKALITGQAPDKGLYLPKEIPQISADEIRSLQKRSYPEIARFVIGKFVPDSLSPNRLLRLCNEAYTFDVPLEQVSGKQYIMRLDQGPTASFKDFAAQMMARLFSVVLENDKKELIILTATSGDTGSAIAHAFYQIPNIKVMVLFPPSEVSNRQRKQMTTLGENITIVGIDGKFDDCQALVKRAFSDSALRELSLTSANSINVGRLLPQIVYYVYAYCKLAKDGEPIVFSVPSGNFGNMMGALLAERMGLPIQRLVIATNANDEVPIFLKRGIYQKIVPSRVCISNAMNVGHPSNFVRVIDLYGGWMDEVGVIHKPPDIEWMRRELWSVSIHDDETRETIRNAWESHRLLLEPHGAVGWAGLNRFVKEEKLTDDLLMVSVETAHPAKFPEEIEGLLGFSPDVPESLSAIENKKEHYLNLPNDYSAFRDLLQEKYGS